MTDTPSRPPADSLPDDLASLRSPVRPVPPPDTTPAVGPPLTRRALPASPPPPDAAAALASLLRKMEDVASQFARGEINRAQFNAVYGRYKEQRTLIERLVERDPGSSAWQQAAAPGHTDFLLRHFEARPLYYVIYALETPRLLMTGGRTDPDLNQLQPVLNALFQTPGRRQGGIARKEMGNGQWLLLAVGERAVTLVMFALEPSNGQIIQVRDLHAEFERANRDALARGTRSLERLVFPQRALVE